MEIAELPILKALSARQPDCFALAWCPFVPNIWASEEEKEREEKDQGSFCSQYLAAADNYQRDPSNASQCTAHNPPASEPLAYFVWEWNSEIYILKRS